MITRILTGLWAACCLGLLAGQAIPLPEVAIVTFFVLATASAATLYYLAMREEE